MLQAMPQTHELKELLRLLSRSTLGVARDQGRHHDVFERGELREQVVKLKNKAQRLVSKLRELHAPSTGRYLAVAAQSKPFPGVGGSSVPRMWSSVLLPTPDAPVIATISPGWIAKSTPRITVISLFPLKKDLRIPSARTKGGVLSSFFASFITQPIQRRAPGNLKPGIESCQKGNQERQRRDQCDLAPLNDNRKKSNVVNVRREDRSSESSEAPSSDPARPRRPTTVPTNPMPTPIRQNSRKLCAGLKPIALRIAISLVLSWIIIISVLTTLNAATITITVRMIAMTAFSSWIA